MNLRAVTYLIGMVLLLMAGFLVVPALVAWHYDEGRALWSFVVAAVATGAAGAAIALLTRGSTVSKDGQANFFRREGLAVVGLTWLVVSIVGALPYLFVGTFRSLADALFEAVSGFTTTGSTVMSAEGIDSMPKSVAFWRSFTHWLGGFGIVMVFVVLFPTGGRSLFRSEVPGVMREAGAQRVRDSAVSLLRVYFGLSALQFLILWPMMHSWFDAAVHTFGTIATGGFSSYSASVSAFASVRIEAVIIVFMVLSGLNFGLYDVLFRSGPKEFVKRVLASAEARTFLVTLGTATLLIAVALWLWGGGLGRAEETLPDYRYFGRALRDSAFQVASLHTSAGFGTADYDRWPQFCRVLLMLLAAIGGCAGSTAGGIKVVRILIIFRAAMQNIRRFIRPRAIHQVHMDGQSLPAEVVASVTSFFALWMVAFGLGTLLLSALGIDPESAASAVIVSINNVGPGLHLAGPSLNLGPWPETAKLILVLLMILGRLEFYAVVALFVPDFWRK